ncbi:MAG: RluA family pseudouridine synthase [Phycisphaerales bacterium]|nr:RluA family pseudouridine synthase [Phycisphaerales bacterium]
MTNSSQSGDQGLNHSCTVRQFEPDAHHMVEPLEVIYRDERLLALNKPVGLLSVPGIGAEKVDSIVTRAATQFPGARILHRLDRDTSGVILLAFDAQAHRELSRQFHDREVRKTYIAVVSGLVKDDSGEIDLPMRKDMDPRNAPRQVIDRAQGRRAITRWHVLERAPDRTRVKLFPITGRSHQLRLHMKTIGHPIAGDDLYAPEKVLAMAERLMLHAESLTVIHPTTTAMLTLHAPTPF